MVSFLPDSIFHETDWNFAVGRKTIPQSTFWKPSELERAQKQVSKISLGVRGCVC